MLLDVCVHEMVPLNIFIGRYFRLYHSVSDPFRIYGVVSEIDERKDSSTIPEVQYVMVSLGIISELGISQIFHTNAQK